MPILTNVKNVLAVTLVLAVAVLMSVAAPVKAGISYSGGSGTSGDPYQIGTTSDWVHLTETSSDWGDYFILTADLNFGGATIQPIGDGGCDFRGSFDGNDHVVSNARIARLSTETYLIGLFGLVGSTGLVKDLGAEDITLVCRTMSGVLVGQNEGTITNCYAIGGSISFSSPNTAATQIGGLVGAHYFGTISNCYADIDISVNGKNSQYIGGLVGYMYESTVEKCCATGSVTVTDASSQFIGGLVGEMANSSYLNRCVLQNCYASGAVSGNSCVGGLAGGATMGGGMTISNCYAIGSVTGTTYVGGLVGAGFTGYTDIATASYWNTQTTGQNSSSVGTARTTDPMTYAYAADTYQGWDFTNVWTADTQNKNGGYPYLKWQLLKAPAEIRVEGNAAEIVSGDTTPSLSDHTDFGSADMDSGTVERTFTIKNTGEVELTLSGNPKVAVSGTNAADFSVTTQPSSPVAASGSTTFKVTFNPSSTGTRTASLSIASSDADENPYTFSIQGKGTRVLTVIGITAEDKVYDTTKTATLDTTGASLVGVVPGDDVTLITSSVTGTFSNEHAESGKTVSITGLTLNGTDAPNYSLTQPTATANITKKELTVIGITASDKTYDGTVNATLDVSNAELVGAIFANDPSLVYPELASGVFSDKHAGTGKIVTISGLTMNGEDVNNYYLTQPTTTANITPKTLAVNATGVDKVYDGTATANVTFSDDRIAGDTLTVEYTAASFADKHVGTNKVVSVTGISLNGADAGNYTPNTTTATSANITKRPITVIAVTDTKIYDGNNSSSVAPTLTSGSLAPGDTVTWTQSFDTKNVGTNKTLTPVGTVDDGNNGVNYNVTYTPVTTGEITVKILPVTGITASDKVYDGELNATIDTAGALLVGVVPGDTVTLITSSSVGLFDTARVGSGKTVSVTGLTLNGTDASHYSLTQPTATANITKKELTVIGITASDKVYDGNATATLDTTGASLVGAITRDDVTLDKSAAAGNFPDKTVGTNKTVAVSGLTLSGADKANYTLTQPGTTANITAKTLTVNAAGVSKVYDGTTAATVNLEDNRVAGDDVATDYTTANFTDKHVGTNKTVNVAGISVSGIDTGNYNLASTTAATTANITARPITVTAVTDTKVYDGDNSSSGTPTLTSGLGKSPASDALAPGDTATWTQSFDTKNVGTNKTMTPAGTVNDGNSGNNYDVTYTPVATGEITAKELTVTGITASDKVYDGNATATLDTTGASLVGAITGDDVTLDKSAAAGNFPDKTVGTNKTVAVSGLALDGADKDNYSLTQPVTTANITAKALTVTATGIDKVYDGTTAATVNLSDDRIAGDNVTPDYTTANFTNKHVGTNKTVSVAGISVSGIDTGNYNLASTTAATTANITARPITVTAMTDTKVYDGDNSSSKTPALTTSSLAPGDSVTWTQSFDTKNVGTSKTITPAGTVSDGNSGNNYNVTYTPVSTGEITAKGLTVNGITASDKVYDGNTGATLDTTGASLVGPVGGDNVTLDKSAATGNFTDKGVGTNKTVTISGLTLDGAGKANYTLAQPAATANITAKGLTVAGVTANDKVYDGNTTATLDTTGASLVGTVGGDDVTLVTGSIAGAFDNKNVGTDKPVAVSGLTLNGADKANYTLTQPATTADITPKALAVTAAGIDKVYDGTNTATVTLDDDRIAGDSVNLDYTTANFSDKHVGTNKTVNVAGISISGADAGNYNANTTTATTANITKRPVTVTAVTDNRTYDGSVNSTAVPIITLGSLAVGDNATWTQTYDNKNVGTNKALTPTGNVSDNNTGNNYNVTCTPVGTGIITEKELTVTGITASDKVYDGHTGATLSTVNAVLVGVVVGDNVTLNTANVTGNFTDANIGAGKAVNITGLTLNGTDAAYYFLTQPTTTASILAQPGGGGGGGGGTPPDPEPEPEPEQEEKVWVIAVVDTEQEPVARDTEGNSLPVTGGLITVSENQTKLMVNIPVALEEGKNLESFTDTTGLTFADNRLEIDASAAAPDGKALLRIVDETGDLGTKIIIETGDCCGAGDEAVAEVLSVKSNCGYTFGDVTGEDPSVGVVASTVSLDLNTLPEDAEVKITTSKYPDPAAGSAFQLAASGAGMDDISIAYTINVEKTNIQNGTDIASASIIMAAGKDWVEANGGIENVRIIRFDAETGQQQVLETRFLGYDAEGRAVFEGISPDGLSVFGLVGKKAIVEPEEPATPEEDDEPVTAVAQPVADKSGTSETTETAMQKSADATGSSTLGWIILLVAGIAAIGLFFFFIVWKRRKKKEKKKEPPEDISA